MHRTRRFALGALAALPVASPHRPARAGSFPARPVSIVVPYPALGGTDLGARLVAPALAAAWRQPVRVSNRGGSAGRIGAAWVAAAPADGHVLLMGNVGTQAINPSLYTDLPYDAGRAFVPVSLVAELPLVLVAHPSLRVRSAAEFVERARAVPGGLTYGSSGAGGARHVAAEAFSRAHGLQLRHAAYRGGAPLLADLRDARVDVAFLYAIEAVAELRDGVLSPLAVTGATRVPALPGVPTLNEADVPTPAAGVVNWIGLLAPAGTAAATVERISGDVGAALARPEIASGFVAAGAVPRGTSPAAFAALIDRERARYATMIRRMGITVG